MRKLSKKNKSDATSILHFGRVNLLIALIFVLPFLGYGAFYVAKSQASTWWCVQHIYYAGEKDTYGGQCVKNIQKELTNILWLGVDLRTPGTVSYDGVFGSKTKAAVIKYGYARLGYNNNGVVGHGTWLKLCGDADGESPLYSIGYADGCGRVPTSTYGAYYVGMLAKPEAKYSLEDQLEAPVS